MLTIYMTSFVKGDRKRHIVIHIEHRHQTVILKHKSNIASPENRLFLSGQTSDIMPPDADLSFCWNIQTSKQIQQCTFSGTARSYDCNKFSLFCSKADIGKCLYLILMGTICFHHMLYF